MDSLAKANTRNMQNATGLESVSRDHGNNNSFIIRVFNVLNGSEDAERYEHKKRRLRY